MVRITIIIPTLNENENLKKLVDIVAETMSKVDNWEILFIDDNSKDGSQETFQELATHYSFCRYIRRIGRKGLATACIEGMLSSSAQFFVVMDADMQHDHTKIPAMIKILESECAQIVIGTRYSLGGEISNWSKSRQIISTTATKVANLFLPCNVSDPMSGFFATNRNVMNRVYENLSGRGYKILYDIIVSYGKGIIVQEIPYTFKPRNNGESKLTPLVCLDFLFLILDKLVGKYIYIDFLVYTCIGVLGAFFHFSMLFVLYSLLSLEFNISQAIATVTAMTVNYFCHNVITFGAQRLKSNKILAGYMKYFIVCLVGVLASTSVAKNMFDFGVPWWVAGLIGASIGAFSNFFLSKFFVWR